MGPIDYTIDVQSPFQAALQGYQGGAAIRNDQQQQALLAQQQALAAQQRADLSALIGNPNAGARDYAAMTLKYPGLREQFKQSWDTISADQRKGQLDQASQAYAALSSGRPDIAEQLFRDRAAAMRNSGAPEQDIKAQETWADLIKASPEQARHIGGLMLSSVMDPEKFASTYATLGDQGRASDKAPADVAKAEADAKKAGADASTALEKNVWDIANVKSQINERAARLGLDRDKLTTDTQLKLTELQQKFGELPESVAKEVNSATVDAISADQTATKAEDLANRFEKLGGGYGGFGTAAEAWAKLTGNQDALTRARGDYERLKNSEAVRNLPPGSASDADVKMALAGFPPETADSREIAQYLRGVAKINRLNGIMANAKSEWFGAVRSLGKAKSDIEIDGVKVPAGTTFKQFSDSYVPRKAGERTSAATIANSPYAEFANPVSNQPQPAAQ